MIRGLLALVACQLAGDVIVAGLHLPLPGPVLGMALLLALLLAHSARRRRVSSRSAGASGRPAALEAAGTGSALAPERAPSGVGRAADALIRHLQLLFVPAGAGIVLYLPEIARSWVSVVGGIALAWLATLLVSAGSATAVLRLQGRRASRGEVKGA